MAITFSSQVAKTKAIPATSAERVRVAGKFFARGSSAFRVHGVTYGPFPTNAAGEPFPARNRVQSDFAAMADAGINTIRTYHLPPPWLLEQADEDGMAVLVDVPWSKHLCFLESDQARCDAREIVRRAAERGRKHPCVLAYSIGNEIPPDIVRWHGARRVERFLAELRDVAKQADPECLVTYGNYPPTEFLDLSLLDFVTFNVYLHELETFRRYLLRLQNLVGDRPLLLGEIGMDTMREGELAQARFLSGHAREALLMGLAGVVVFSWTDEWHTGGFAIDDWAFGITHADRSPKASYHALCEVFQNPPAALLAQTPRVSVVVCAYNGGRTLEQCLRSLIALNYPYYEIIVVDDGSTDDTPNILARLPEVRAIRQVNRGLSVARNVGLQAATGEIIAYTDSDCFAHPDWLTHVVCQLGSGGRGQEPGVRGQESGVRGQESGVSGSLTPDSCPLTPALRGAAAVGGPNLTPEDGWLAACVAASPGQPTHVLESDQVAEHIPGCNMAFRRSALESINGFDPQYRKAGDDVDVCWRLQQAGHWITFAPGAFVWHHRRATPVSYLRQQAGYGEAEALLRFKHPDKFNGLGDGKWRGVLYGRSLRGLHLNEAIIYRGTFGTGMFQCLYQPGPAHWAMLPSTLEWHLAAALVALATLVWTPAWIGALLMLAASVGVAALQASQARLPPEHEGLASRLLITALCYAQPLVRSWRRYRTRFFSYRPPLADATDLTCRGQGSGIRSQESGIRGQLIGVRTLDYWSEDGCERTQLLGCVTAFLNDHGWGKTLDTGWSDWDMEVHCHPWTVVQVCTAQEEHGGGKRLIRVRFGLRPSGYTRALGIAAGLCILSLVGFSPRWAPVGAVLVLLTAFLGAWCRGANRARHFMDIVDVLARNLGLMRCTAAGATTEGQRKTFIARLTGW